MIVMLCLGETCVGKNLAATSLELGQTATTTQTSTSDFYDASQYDASGYAVAPNRGVKPGDILPDGRIAGNGPGASMHPNLFKRAAGQLGFKKTNFRSNGQPVYKKGNRYISPDVGSGPGTGGSHNGGVWKMASSPEKLGSKTTRMGTFDANLVRIGD